MTEFWLFDQEYRAEIDGKDETFEAFNNFGKELAEKEHYAQPEIKEKLQTVEDERKDLEK